MSRIARLSNDAYPFALRALALAVAVLAAGPALPAAPTTPAQGREPIVLPAPASFAAAVAAIERATGVRAEALKLAGDDVANGREFAIDASVAERLLAGSHVRFRSAGMYLFRFERSFGVGGERDRVGLFPTSDWEVVVRRIGTSGGRRGVTTDRIVAWLRTLAKEEPFDLEEIGVDFVAGRFHRAPADPKAIARRAAEIAPDLVAGRGNEVDLLAEEIRANRTLYLIWD